MDQDILARSQAFFRPRRAPIVNDDFEKQLSQRWVQSSKDAEGAMLRRLRGEAHKARDLITQDIDWASLQALCKTAFRLARQARTSRPDERIVIAIQGGDVPSTDKFSLSRYLDFGASKPLINRDRRVRIEDGDHEIIGEVPVTSVTEALSGLTIGGQDDPRPELSFVTGYNEDTGNDEESSLLAGVFASLKNTLSSSFPVSVMLITYLTAGTDPAETDTAEALSNSYYGSGAPYVDNGDDDAGESEEFASFTGIVHRDSLSSIRRLE